MRQTHRLSNHFLLGACVVLGALALSAPAARSQSFDLTGIWRTDTASSTQYVQYRLRQVGNKLYWATDDLPRVINVFNGTISGDTITGDWIDLPGGELQNTGTLSLRIESNDRFIKLSESIPYGASIWIRQGIRTPKPTYAAFEPPVVEFSGFPGNENDWITVVPAGAPPETQGQFYYTAGRRSGSFTFDGLAPGTYEARAFFNWPAGGRIVRHVAAFVVGDAAPAPVVRTQKPSYAPKEPIVVEYLGFPGTNDWITVTAASNPAEQYGQFFYTGGKQGGFFTFTGLEAGVYEVRAYLNWSAGGYNIVARSSFTVGDVTGGGGICGDPRTLSIMDEWLATAIPPQKPGESLRYEAWGRLVGKSLSATLTVSGPPDTSLSRCEYLWLHAPELQSTNGLGTLKEFVEKRRA